MSDDLKAKLREQEHHTMISVPITLRARPYVCLDDDTMYYDVDLTAPDVKAFLSGHDDDAVQAFVRTIMPDDLEELILNVPDCFYNKPPGTYIWRGSAVIDDMGIGCMVDSFNQE